MLVENSSTSLEKISSVKHGCLKDQLPTYDGTGNSRPDLIVNGTASVSSIVVRSTVRRNIVGPLDALLCCRSLGGRERHTS